MFPHPSNISPGAWKRNMVSKACRLLTLVVRLGTMNRIIDFLTEVRLELEKVVWPTPNLTVKLTVVVILVTILVGFFLGGVDYLLTKILELVLKE